MSARSPALDALIREAEAAASQEADPLSALIVMLKQVIRSDADPYLLSGAMIEGLVATIVERVPPEKRGEVAVEAVRLLRDRLAARGAI
ncbi:MAG: hypothetical protein WDN25_13545 [Acetobacteraceae bacterium]